MKPRFACSDFTFPLLSHDHSLDLIKMLGVKAVDIGLFEKRSHLWPSEEFKNITKNARKLARNLSNRGLKLADVFVQATGDAVTQAPNNPSKRCRNKLRKIILQTLEYAAQANCSHVTATPGVYFKEESKADSFARSCEELSWQCAQAQSMGITFSVEPGIGSIAPVPKQAMKLVKSVPGLTLTLDYTHFTSIGIPDAQIEPLIQHSSHFHARGACKGALQSSVKDNTIDYARIMKVMHRTGYRGYIELEYVWTEFENCTRVDNISETILLREVIQKACKKLSKSKK